MQENRQCLCGLRVYLLTKVVEGKAHHDKKTVDRIAPGQTAEVNAMITPTDKSLAGDYMATIRAASRGETASTQFRVTVATSTTWGMVGFGIIAVALLLMFGAVARFGRR